MQQYFLVSKSYSYCFQNFKFPYMDGCLNIYSGYIEVQKVGGIPISICLFRVEYNIKKYVLSVADILVEFSLDIYRVILG